MIPVHTIKMIALCLLMPVGICAQTLENAIGKWEVHYDKSLEKGKKHEKISAHPELLKILPNMLKSTKKMITIEFKKDQFILHISTGENAESKTHNFTVKDDGNDKAVLILEEPMDTMKKENTEMVVTIESGLLNFTIGIIQANYFSSCFS